MTDFKVNKELEDNTAFKERFVDAIRTFLDVEPPSDYVDEWLQGNPDDSYFHLQEWVVNQERFPLWAQGESFLEAMWEMADDPCDGRGHTRTKDEYEYE